MIAQVGERLSGFVHRHFQHHKSPIAVFTSIPDSCNIGKLEEHLTQGERERAARFHFRSDRDGFVVAHAIKRLSLGALTGLPPKEVHVRLGRHGKPLLGLIRQNDVIQFNLSHTKGMVAFAVALKTPVGVDVERMNPDVETASLARSFLAAQDTDLLNEVPATERHRAFFQLWTSKEAYIKGIGLGLSYPLKSFFVQSLDGKSRVCSSQTGAPLDWVIQNYQPTPEYYMSSAIKCPCNCDCDVTFLKLPFLMIG